jgi:hypothetical protein
VRDWERELRRRRLGPEDVLSPAPPPAGLRRRVGFALAAPVAAAGLALNVVPYQTVDALARHLTHTPDEPATYKVLGAMVVFPLAWAAQAALAFHFAGSAAAALVFAAGPIAGYAALRWIEGWQAARARARRRRLLARGRRLAALSARGDALRATLRAALRMT